MRLLTSYGLVVLLILLVFQESLAHEFVCDTDANCEAWYESTKLNYRGVVD